MTARHFPVRSAATRVVTALFEVTEDSRLDLTDEERAAIKLVRDLCWEIGGGGRMKPEAGQ